MVVAGEGQRLEYVFGRDAGNGWAYNHALGKLRLYQVRPWWIESDAACCGKGSGWLCRNEIEISPDLPRVEEWHSAAVRVRCRLAGEAAP